MKCAAVHNHRSNYSFIKNMVLRKTGWGGGGERRGRRRKEALEEICFPEQFIILRQGKKQILFHQIGKNYTPLNPVAFVFGTELQTVQSDPFSPGCTGFFDCVSDTQIRNSLTECLALKYGILCVWRTKKGFFECLKPK